LFFAFDITRAISLAASVFLGARNEKSLQQSWPHPGDKCFMDYPSQDFLIVFWTKISICHRTSKESKLYLDLL